jgi:hypothetical protein
LLPDGVDVPFGDSSLRGIRHILLKLVHGRSGLMGLWWIIGSAPRSVQPRSPAAWPSAE